MLTTYFGDLGGNLDLALSLGANGLHLDLVRAPEQLKIVLDKESGDLSLSLGLVDGRNIWRTDLTAAVALVQQAVVRLGTGRVQVAPSCSLLHSPVDLELEHHLDAEVRSWLSFARQKLEEVAVLARSIDAGPAIATELEANAKVVVPGALPLESIVNRLSDASTQ
jgi:5-methyltetrahydropteroyltriglutamate--homocysteine methyltransferase